MQSHQSALQTVHFVHFAQVRRFLSMIPSAQHRTLGTTVVHSISGDTLKGGGVQLA